jgi:hypothetical protein
MMRLLFALALVATLVAPAMFAAPVAADHESDIPETHTVYYNESQLETYRPYLDTRTLDVQPLALHGMIVESTEHDTTVYVYWVEYTHQDGVSEWDSHYGDHEPVYVFVDERGNVEKTVYSGYHWMAARDYARNVENGTHPAYKVVNPWHHYVAVPEGSQEVSVYSTTPGEVPLKDLTTSMPAWMDNGLEPHVAEGVVYDPWTMESRESWWNRNVWETRGYWFARIYYTLGWHEADLVDDLVGL